MPAPRRLCVLFSAALLLAAWPSATAQGLFSRFTRSTEERKMAAATDAATTAAKAAASAASAAAGSGAASGAAGSATSFVDSWATDPMLKMAQRALDGDHFSLITDMFSNSDMKTIWAKPEVAKHLLNGMPIFKTFNGIPDLISKGDSFTSQDGLKALDIISSYVQKVPTAMTDVLDSKNLANKMRDYANTDDPTLKSLYKQVQGGDFNAYKELHQTIADKEWGGLLNLDELGLNGKEPDSVKQLRTLMMDQEPDLFELVHQNDPMIKQYVSDPTRAYQEAMAAAGLNK